MSPGPSHPASEDDGRPIRNQSVSPVTSCSHGRISSYLASCVTSLDGASTTAANIPSEAGGYASFLSNSTTVTRAHICEDSESKISIGGHQGNDPNHFLSGWWWWWEIFAMALSIACIMPLQSWWLPIQLNSLVAAVTTIAKASMMVPVVSCIGQLKWRHFMEKPRRLIDLQLFDDASRGPWGSAVLLWTLCFRARLLVTFGLSLVTIVALGIETSAQQVIAFPLREARLNNVSAELGVADTYTTKSFPRQTGTGMVFPMMCLLWRPHSLIDAVTGTIAKPHFACPEPATRCQWDTFTTLGVCANFDNVTDVAASQCVNNTSGTSCTYTVPGVAALNLNRSDLECISHSENCQSSDAFFQSSFQRNQILTGPLDTFVAMNGLQKGERRRITDNGFTPPTLQVYSNTLTWCAQTFSNITGSQVDINSGSVSREDLSFVAYWRDENPDGTMGRSYYYFGANSTCHRFSISLLSNVFRHEYSHDYLGPEGQSLRISFSLKGSDLNKAMASIADTLTSLIRAKDHGDNYNASIATGAAFFNETYIHVRWGWMALPLSEVLLTALLLVVTIAITRDQPLLGQSVVALLTNGLEGWSSDEL
ncbi:hypothetical protein GGR52DRAFT_580056 [Hypoxylon sp. FL1284]|nr:hypothetical protein GGR52DRAFT_580056 [Hypoxylon sp. FL1284]